MSITDNDVRSGGSVNRRRRRVEFGPYVFDLQSRSLSAGSRAIDLPDRAARVLCALVKRPNQIVRKSELMEAAWGNVAVSEQSLTEAAFLIRRAVGDDPRSPAYIETVRGRGLRFIATVRLVDQANEVWPEGRARNPARKRAWRRLLGVGCSIAATGVTIWATSGSHRSYAPVPPWAREEVSTTLDSAPERAPGRFAVSPDGTHIVYPSGRVFVVRRVDGIAERQIDFSRTFRPPVFSPDGRQIAWVGSERVAQLELARTGASRGHVTVWIYDVASRASRELCSNAQAQSLGRLGAGSRPVWLSAERLLVSTERGLVEIDQACHEQGVRVATENEWIADAAFSARRGLVAIEVRDSHSPTGSVPARTPRVELVDLESGLRGPLCVWRRPTEIQSRRAVRRCW